MFIWKTNQKYLSTDLLYYESYSVFQEIKLNIYMIFRMQSLSKLKRTICKMSSPKNDSPHVVVKPCNMVARQSVPAPNKQLVDLKWVVLTDDRIGMLP